MGRMDDMAEQYYSQVYHYLVSLTKNAALAEDLTQETFCQAVVSIDRFRGECTMYVWLCQSISFTNTCAKRNGMRK
mgnify:CR=1 FL=1